MCGRRSGMMDPRNKRRREGRLGQTWCEDKSEDKGAHSVR